MRASERIYVATSWRCPAQPAVIARLRAENFAVYDFKHPPESTAFHWSEVGVNSSAESVEVYLQGLAHQRAEASFRADFDAMQWADTCVLVLPCGRSAHLELGWCAGAGKRTAILLDPDPVRPKLMYKLADLVTPSVDELVRWLRSAPVRPDEAAGLAGRAAGALTATNARQLGIWPQDVAFVYELAQDSANGWLRSGRSTAAQHFEAAFMGGYFGKEGG